MELTRYIIWTTSLEDTTQVLDILDPHSSLIVSITGVIVCLETDLSMARIRAYLGDEMEVALVPITESFIKKLMTTKFLEEERKNFSRFLELTKVPKTIDEALDLINEKGGVEFLSAREKYALDQLTKKSDKDESEES